MSFAKNICKIFSGKYGQNIIDHAKQPATDALNATNCFKKRHSKATGNLIGSRIADKIKKVTKTSPQNSLETENENIGSDTKIPKERYISP